MKTISLRQPWAWMICQGFKPVENRTWNTNHRGPILIHASKTFDMAGYDWILENRHKLKIFDHRIPFPDEYYKGGVIGRANLVRSCRQNDSAWFFGPWGFVLTDPELFERPIAYPGKLNIFEITDRDIIQNINGAASFVNAGLAVGHDNARSRIPQIQKLLF